MADTYADQIKKQKEFQDWLDSHGSAAAPDGGPSYSDQVAQATGAPPSRIIGTPAPYIDAAPRDTLEQPKYVDVTEEREKRLKSLYENKTLTPVEREQQREQIDKDTITSLPEAVGKIGSPTPLSSRYLTGSNRELTPTQQGPTGETKTLASEVKSRLGLAPETASPAQAGPKLPMQPVTVSKPVTAQQPSGGGYAGSLQAAMAHSVALADPRMQAELMGAFGDEAQARLNAGDAMAEGQDVAGAGYEEAGKQAIADQAQVAANVHARQAYLDKLGHDIERDSKALAEEKVDPDHFWNSRSIFQRILGIIAMGLGGYAGRGQVNVPAQMIEAAVRDDVAAQRSNIENKWASLKERHSVLADRAQQYGSLDVAEKQQIAAKMQAALLVVQGAAARATSPVERANAQALAAQIEQKAIEAGISMNKWVASGQGGPAALGMTKDIKSTELVRIGNQWVATGDPERARQMSSQNLAAQHVIGQAQQLIDLLNDPETMNPFSAKRGLLKEISKGMAVEDMKEASSGGRGSLGIINLFTAAQGKIDSLNPIARKQAIQALRGFQQRISENVEARNKELHGNAVVERVVDPVHQRSGLRVTGTYNYAPTTQANTYTPKDFSEPK